MYISDSPKPPVKEASRGNKKRQRDNNVIMARIECMESGKGD